MTDTPTRTYVWKELLLLWLGTLLLIRLIVFLHSSLGLHEIFLGLVPLLFVYAPVWLCTWRGVDSWGYQLSIPAFRDGKSWGAALRLCLVVNLCLWVWYIPLYDFWVGLVAGKKYIGTMPKELWMTIAYHFFYVAIPEEFFYRGYMQTRFNEVYPKKIRIFGVSVGMGLIWTSVLFAFGHSVVMLQWWHFAIFFPSLLFGWMREKSGGILSGAMIHACCNVGITVLDTMYGIRSPI